MSARPLLTWLPLLLIGGLVQSAWWAPSGEREFHANPARRDMFVEAASADAKLLNPILHADAASGRIVDLVFDGLLDLGEDLELRGRIARTWRVYERALLAVDTESSLADSTPVTPQTLLAALRRHLRGGTDLTLARRVSAMRVIPPRQRTRVITLDAESPSPIEVEVKVDLPARIEITLTEVDPDLLARLAPVLGDGYGVELATPRRIEVRPAAFRDRVEARLADLLPVLEHNPVIDFELRRGVRFHDGHEVDAGDVRFTYEAIMNPRNLSPRASDFEPIAGVEVLDPYRVRVTYKRLFSPAVNAWAAMGVLPEHLLNDAALAREMDERGLSSEARARFGIRESRFNRHPVGSGPYRFGAWLGDEHVHLLRNPDYWDGVPLLAEYYYRVLPDSLSREIEFRSGAVDGYALQPYQVARFRNAGDYRVLSTVGLGYTYIGYNARRPPFDDPRVRRALGMAIDVDAITRHVLYGEGERTTGPYPINTEWNDPGVSPLPYDPDGAERALRELGWERNAAGWLEKDGRVLEFNLITNNGNEVRKAILSIAQAAWRRIGVRCNTQVFEWAVFLEDFINPGEFDAVILGWLMGPDPDLFQIWHSSQTGRNQLNFVAYRSAEADRLIERIREEYDRDAQRRLARELHRVVARDQPYTFLFAPRSTHVLDHRLVMVAPDGTTAPVRPGRGGDVYFHMNRWTRVAAEAAP